MSKHKKYTVRKKGLGKPYEYVISSNDKFKLPISENVSVTVVGAGGGGAGAVYDNITTPNVLNFYSAGGGGGGCGEKKVLNLKKCYKPLSFSIKVGKGGIGGIGGLLNTATNGQNGQESSICINKNKYKVGGGGGGFIGSSSKNGGNGGFAGGGGGGGLNIGGIGGQSLYGIQAGQNGYSATSPVSVFMDGGDGTLNTGSGGIGSSFILNGAVLTVGGGGGGCLTGIGGSCEQPAISCVSTNCDLYGGGGGGGAGFNLDSVGGANGANGQDGQVIIVGTPIIFEIEEHGTNKCKIDIVNREDGVIVSSEFSGRIDIPRSINANSLDDCSASNPSFIGGNNYNNITGLVCDNPNIIDYTYVIATTYKFFIGNLPPPPIIYINLEIGGGGGAGGNANGGGSGGGGSGGVAKIISNLVYNTIIVRKLFGIVGGPGTQTNLIGGSTGICFIYADENGKINTLDTHVVGGHYGHGSSRFNMGYCGNGGSSIQGYGGGGGGAFGANKDIPGCEGGFGVLGTGYPGGNVTANQTGLGAGGNGAGPYGGKGGNTRAGIDSYAGSGGGGGGPNSYNYGGNGGDGTTNDNGGVNCPSDSYCGKNGGYSGGGGGGGVPLESGVKTGGNGGSGYIRIFFSTTMI